MTPGIANLGCAPAAALQIDVLQGPEAIASAKDDWLALCQQGGAPTAFQSYGVVAACAAAHLRRHEVPRIAIARRGHQPIVIIPLVITKWLGARVVRFLGDPLIQYGDVLAAPGVHDDDIAPAWEAALNVDAALALLRRVRTDGRTAACLARRCNEVATQESALVEFRDAPALSPRNARELRRLRRRLAEQGKIDISFPTGEEARRALDRGLTLKRAWMREHAVASAVIGDGDWEPALTDMFAAGALRVAVLTVDGHIAAVELALCDAACWYGFLGAFDPRFAKSGPGHVLTAACIEKARSEGLACYDQLPPAQPYKRQQATRLITVADYALPFSAQGKLVTTAAKLAPDLKSMFASLPAGLRQGVLTLMQR